MGVKVCFQFIFKSIDKNLWTLIEPSRRNIPIPKLHGKTIAVDISIWFHQIVKGILVRQKDTILEGDAQLNHELNMRAIFRRIIRLLQFGIKPIFIFDGATPALKIKEVRRRRENYQEDPLKFRKLAQKLLKYQLDNVVRTKKSRKPGKKKKETKKKQKKSIDGAKVLKSWDEMIPDDAFDGENENENRSITEFVNTEQKKEQDKKKEEETKEIERERESIVSFLDSLGTIDSEDEENEEKEVKKEKNPEIETKIAENISILEKTPQKVQLIPEDKSFFSFEATPDDFSAKQTQFFLQRSSLSKRSISPHSTNLTPNMNSLKLSSPSEDEVSQLKQIETVDPQAKLQNFLEELEDDKQDDEFETFVPSEAKKIDIEDDDDDGFVTFVASNQKNDENLESETDDDEFTNDVPKQQTDNDNLLFLDNENDDFENLLQKRQQIFGDSNALFDKDALERILASNQKEQNTEANSNFFIIDDEKKEEEAKIEIDSSNPPQNDPIDLDFDEDDEELEDIFFDSLEKDQKQNFNKEFAQKMHDLEEAMKGPPSQSSNSSSDSSQSEKFFANAAGIYRELLSDTKRLISLLGLPFIQSPQESDAQCGYLSILGLIDGVITEDIDVFLFGAKVVYRDFFRNVFKSKKNQKKKEGDNEKDYGEYVAQYDMDDLKAAIGLERENLVELAFLFGSDYCEGVSNVGLVVGTEICQAFFKNQQKNEDIGVTVHKALDLFKKWINEQTDALKNEPNFQKIQIFEKKNKTLKKKVSLPDSFGAERVIKGYTSPIVEKNVENLIKFGEMDRHAIFAFGWEKMKWRKEEMDKNLRYLVQKEQQTKNLSILDFFAPRVESELLAKGSKRMRNAINSMKESEENEEAEAEEKDVATTPKKKRKVIKQKKIAKVGLSDLEKEIEEQPSAAIFKEDEIQTNDDENLLKDIENEIEGTSILNEAPKHAENETKKNEKKEKNTDKKQKDSDLNEIHEKGSFSFDDEEKPATSKNEKKTRKDEKQTGKEENQEKKTTNEEVAKVNENMQITDEIQEKFYFHFDDDETQAKNEQKPANKEKKTKKETIPPKKEEIPKKIAEIPAKIPKKNEDQAMNTDSDEIQEKFYFHFDDDETQAKNEQKPANKEKTTKKESIPPKKEEILKKNLEIPTKNPEISARKPEIPTKKPEIPKKNEDQAMNTDSDEIQEKFYFQFDD